jgi:hypothetical protein
LSDPEAGSGEEGGVGWGRGAGWTPTGPVVELGDIPPPVDEAGRLSGMNKLPSAGRLGGGGDAIEDGGATGAGEAGGGGDMGLVVAG